MLYVFNKEDQINNLPPLKNLTIKECNSPVFMAVLCNISIEQARDRLANDHRAFVAYYEGAPAAFGWMAMGKANIGELDHEFVLPLWHRYLWNFRTLPEFRGLGIYPRLLCHIIQEEQKDATSIWIMHAPENEASERGIRKAGFRFLSKMSVDPKKRVTLQIKDPAPEALALINYGGFTNTEAQQATCWNCSSPYVKNKKEKCCCSEKGKVGNHKEFSCS